MDCTKKLIALMEDRRLTFSDLEKRSGISRSTLHGWTTGRSARRLEDIIKVSEALNISFLDLFFESSERPLAGLRLKIYPFKDFKNIQEPS